MLRFENMLLEKAFPSFIEGARYNFRNRDRGTEVSVGGELDFLAITIFFLQRHSPANPLQAKLNHIILLSFFLARSI
jgi:hypothetical protein